MRYNVGDKLTAGNWVMEIIYYGFSLKKDQDVYKIKKYKKIKDGRIEDHIEELWTEDKMNDFRKRYSHWKYESIKQKQFNVDLLEVIND